MRPPEEVKKELVRRWLAKADQDIRAGEALLAADRPFSYPVCFHSQQAAEKYLKALLTWHQIEFPKTHAIEQLLALLRPTLPDVASSLGEAAVLTWDTVAGPPDLRWITIQVADSQGAASRQRFPLETVPPTAPRIVNTPPVTASAGIEYRYNVQVSDQTGTPISYTLTAAPSGMTRPDPTSNPQLITWTPTCEQAGQVTAGGPCEPANPPVLGVQHQFTVRVQNGLGVDHERTFTVLAVDPKQGDLLPPRISVDLGIPDGDDTPINVEMEIKVTITDDLKVVGQDVRLTDASGTTDYLSGQTLTWADTSGSVLEQYEYGDFGRPTIYAPDGSVRAASAVGNPYLFTGRYWDPETGLYYYRSRYYDPRAGRFTSRDWGGAWADLLNLGNAYTYVASNPWTLLDPYGLESVAAYPSNEGGRGGRYATTTELRQAAQTYDIPLEVTSTSDLVAKLEDLSSRGIQLDSLHILGHGKPGYQQIGADIVDVTADPVTKSNLKRIGDLIDPKGTIELWGCNVGKDPEGRQFVTWMATVTNRQTTAYADYTRFYKDKNDMNKSIRLFISGIRAALGLETTRESVFYNHGSKVIEAPRAKTQSSGAGLPRGSGIPKSSGTGVK